MNTVNSIDPSGPQGDKPEREPAVMVKKTGGAMVWAALFLSLLAVGLAAVTYRLVRVQQSDTTVVEQLSQNTARMNTLQEKQGSLGAQLTDIQTSINKLEQAQQASAESLRGLAGNMAIDNTELAVAEVEQLMIMAIHNLTLERDVNTALAALEAADRRLASLDEPQLLNTRSQLAADMNALRSVNQVDTSGLSLYLSDLLGRVEALPLNKIPIVETSPANQPEDAARPAWQRLLLAVWQEFRGMIVITRTGSNAKATLLPGETWFLYQNLRLQLETARLAVIRQDTQSLHTAMQSVSMWLTDYFDTSDSSVANIIQTAEKMASLDLTPELPDISSSLETLHAFIKDYTAVDTTDPGTVSP